MNWDDEGMSTLSGAGSGAASGAAVGSVIAPGFGTGIGAGIGALAGGALGYFRGHAQAKQKQGLAEARMRLQQLQKEQYAQRMADLQKAMAFFGPAQAAYEHLYGAGTAPKSPAMGIGGPSAAPPAAGPASWFRR